MAGSPTSRVEKGVERAPSEAVERTPVDGACPECGAEELASYPVVAEIGWEQVVKCGRCLCSVSRRPWRRLGPLELLVDSLPDA
jgi:hypothetical protein